ncbi:RNA polymerase sigma factor [Proteinivorax tanatarense]|uniref:RNA polymerase sigma factor n=1 Tax=Proteinivorax tanatarense TaxID=1260629 RepID=A0AAU7VJ20_9FIRM
MEEQVLVKRFIDGEQSAFIEVYNMYFQDVYNFVAYSVGITCCEDVTQEIFVKVYRKMKSFKGKSSIKSWVFNIARRSVYDHYRKNKKHLNLDDYSGKLMTNITPEDILEHKSELESTLKILGTLKCEQRTVILLRRLHGFSIKETSKIMGVKESAVKTLLHRGMKNLENKSSADFCTNKGVINYE